MHRMAGSRTRAGAMVLLLALAVPGAYGQQGTVHRVGQLSIGSAGGEVQPYFDTFVAAMRKLGYVEGRNFILDRRWADGSRERLGPLADELIALKPDVLLGNEAIAQIMRAKTTSIPIVLTSSIDPVKTRRHLRLRDAGHAGRARGDENDTHRLRLGRRAGGLGHRQELSEPGGKYHRRDEPLRRALREAPGARARASA